MKKLLIMLLTLLLCVPAFAETPVAIPVQRTGPANGTIALSEAITTAMASMPVQPEQYQTRAELVYMSDNSRRWIVTMFDLATLSDGWCVEMDAFTGNVATSYTTHDGFFWDAYNAWTAQKGPHALWSLEDKQLYDALYAVMPAYGLPMPGDISAEDALKKALNVLAMDTAGGYEVGYGYLMGGEGYNGVWEICLVVDGQVDCRVNLDAVTGEVYYMETNLQDADEANG